MKLERLILSLLVLLTASAAAFYWKKSAALEKENTRLQAQVGEFEQSATSNIETARRQMEELKRLRQQTTELMSLRNEVTQLRSGSKNAEGLGAEVARLRAENQQLRSASGAVPPLPGAAAADEAPQGARIPQENWNFAGYASPEDALVSAVWAMKEGKLETYLDSLSPAEQERMAQVWKDQPEEEIAAKHRREAGAIQAFQVLDKQAIGPGEVVMDVQIEVQGQPAVRRVRMNQNGQEWKFGGFMEGQQQ